MNPSNPPARPALSAGVAGLLSACLASGCVTAPQSQKLPPLVAPERYASAVSFQAPEGQWPQARWWESYQDPQLTRLIEEGLAGATDLRVAAARFQQAAALAQVAGSRLSPSLGLDAQAGGTKQSYHYLIPGPYLPQGWKDYGQATLNLDWEIDFWGRNRAALAAARSEQEAAGAEAAAARLAVAAGIADAYAGLAGLYAQLDSVKGALEVRHKTLELLKGRQAQGLEHEGAVDRALSALEATEGERAALEEAIHLGQNAIAALLGAGPDRGQSIGRPADVAPKAFGLPANLPVELLGRRPDVIAARLRTEAAASRIKEAHAAFYPNINLAALVGYQALGLGNVLNAGSLMGTAGPALSLPIFDGGQLRGQYHAAEAEYRIAVAQYGGALTQALREVADTAASERALGERLSRAGAAEQAAAAAWQVVSNRYRGGLATYLDVLSAQDALIEARRAVAVLKTRAFALDIALNRALGGGLHS